MKVLVGLVSLYKPRVLSTTSSNSWRRVATGISHRSTIDSNISRTRGVHVDVLALA
jgi:hypothetical protein